ncbi:hypothetical protein DERP_014685 [Dermatophagoides pteronyssinus]|uniref:Uncharacterized protein n=1 Tax=Dermatophagoides pteronyssinus TaxID=6956 RepID=A0ABQ8JRL8_DERPT|nr:hypothetical protein DERP_014685 [Dermatophagoides pteronyssinus]
MTTTNTETAGTSTKVDSITSTTGNNNNNNNNMVTVSNVAEIFHAAGYAFKKLSELIQSMDPTNDPTISATVNNNNGGESDYQTHWEPADVEHFSSIVTTFTEDLNQLAENLKTKMGNRLREEHAEAKMQTLSSKQQELIQSTTTTTTANTNNLPSS